MARHMKTVFQFDREYEKAVEVSDKRRAQLINQGVHEDNARWHSAGWLEGFRYAVDVRGVGKVPDDP